MIAALAHAADTNERARRRVNHALDGPVMATLVTLVPELTGLPRDRALEIVLNDCSLLHRCFLAFRAERPRFRDLLMDRHHRPVDNDNTQLICGRTVNQVVSMIVRSAAKRHFHLRLERRGAWDGHSRSRLAPPSGQGWPAMLDWMTGQPPARREKPPADQLYDAIRQYLLHDWQVPIIPQYARMSPPEVRALGSRILDFHDAAEFAAYLNGGDDWQPAPASLPIEQPDVAAAERPSPPLAPPMPLPEPVVGTASLPSASLVPKQRASLGTILTADRGSLRMETIVPILVRQEIRDALGRPSPQELRDASRLLSRTGAVTIRQLVVDFGLPAEHMTVMLTAAALALPPPVFERLFGPHCEAALVTALVRRARSAGLGGDSPPAAFGAFIRNLFGRFGY